MSEFGSGQFHLDANFSSLHANQQIAGKPFRWSETQKGYPRSKQSQTQTNYKEKRKRNPLLNELNC